MSTQLDQIAKKAKSNPKLRFTSLAHLLTPEFLTETWKQMNRRGASGIDGETDVYKRQGAGRLRVKVPPGNWVRSTRKQSERRWRKRSRRSLWCRGSLR